MTELDNLNRIRNLEEKVSELDPDGQVVKGITDRFCQAKISSLQGELEEEKERVRDLSCLDMRFRICPRLRELAATGFSALTLGHFLHVPQPVAILFRAPPSTRT